MKKECSLCDLFKPYVEKLISHLCTHCQLDEDTNPVWWFDGITSSHDHPLPPPSFQLGVPEDDDFDDFRKSVVELLRDVIFITGSLNCFSEVGKNRGRKCHVCTCM